MSQGAKYAIAAGLGALAYPIGLEIGQYLGRRNGRANAYVFGVR